ncbi:hypothetical protein BJ912DRAFT_1020382 [Pholiota molesta]|nr:hypothetical protein BJ912DRAFT_1020382 [Pholiota molesta]
MSTNAPPNPNPRQAPNFGLPPRPLTASTPLWAHILEPKTRLPTKLSEMPSVIPPPAPLDKNATSMRILLHDTQANLEKFGEHVQRLVEGVKETKHEIKTTNTLFERDRETLVGDITDLVNRSQKEIQKAIGSPATNDCVQSFFKDVSGRLTELDHRINAIQAFNQTHSQALQSQMRAVQILLDKQGSILTAVLPLLPLLQALPLHIDAAKTGICENFAKAFSAHIYATPKVNDMTICTSEESSAIKDTLTRKRKHADGNTMTSSSSPIPHHRTFSLKRLRTEPPGHSTPNSVQPRETATSPGVPSTSKLSDAQAPLRRNECASGISPLSHGIPAAASSVSHRSGGYGGTFAVPTFSTPMNRRPLSDLLPLPPSRQNPRPTPRKRGLATLPLASSELLCGPGFPGRRLRSNTATATAAANANAGMPTVPPGRVYAANAPPGARRLSIGSDVHSSPRSVQRRPTISLTSPAIREAEERSESTAADRVMPSTSGVSVAAASGIAQDATPKPDPRNSTGDMRDSDQAVNRRSNPPQNALLDLQKGNRNRVLFGKERLSPVREGRRFIPLVDSEDEDEENE